MNKGTVKFFNENKGFGFIVPDDGTRDVFLHKSNLTQNVSEGDKVTYEIDVTEKGPSAINVILE